MIILAHFDERLGIPYAHLFAQKGFENVFLISGGTDFFIYMNTYPEYIEGTKVPVVVKPKEELSNSGKK